MSVSLEASHRACREVTRARARNFYYGLRLTPEPRRSALYAIYTWMRVADDLADETSLNGTRLAALDRWGELTERAIAGEAVPDGAAVWPAFSETLANYPIEPGWVRSMLDGLRGDVQGVSHRTRADLDAYCDRVASTVGLCCVAIWGLAPGADVEEARTLAIAQGRAFQLTNILRDLGADLSERPSRSYLPSEAYTEAGLTPEDIREWRSPDICTGFVRRWVSEARPGYDAADRLNTMLGVECRPVHRVMTRIYLALLDRIHAHPRLVAGPSPASVSPVVKARIAISGVMAARMGSGR